MNALPASGTTGPDADEITRSSGSNLAFAFACLPAERRRNMNTFYAFCRVVDDIADAPDLEPETKRHRLAEWEELVRGTREPGPGLASGFARLLRDHPSIRQEDVLEILAGMSMDLGRVRYATCADLERYCYRVASAVGLVSVEIFGCAHPDARRYAVELGHALQWTNIIRDVGEDLREADRLYLPQEDLDRFGVTEDDLRAPVTGDKVRALLAFEADRARARFREAARWYPTSDRRALRASELMRHLYETLLGNMERGDFRVLERRFRLSPWQKTRLLWGHLFG